MSSSFLTTASKKVTDVRGFLRDAAGGNSIKYVPEKGSKHLLYIPYKNGVQQDESGATQTIKELEAISGPVHEWQSPDGKYRATVCIKDLVRKSENGEEMLNDGSCPFCDRVSDGWDIYRYRKELEEATCKLTGADRAKHLEVTNRTFADERKAKDARMYMYILVVKYRQDASQNIVMGADNLPEYDLKVMKLSASRVDKIQQQVANAGSELPGSELMFEYPAVDDRRLQVSQSTTAPIFPNNMLTVKFPGLIDKINQDVAKFEWEGIEKSFPEWNGMTSMEAKKITDELFEDWDKYNAELALNPGAQYMEYVTNTPVTTPQLGGNVAPAAAIPSVPEAPVLPGVPTPGAVTPSAAIPGGPAIPGAAIPGAAIPGAPDMPNLPDPNALFGGSGSPLSI